MAFSTSVAKKRFENLSVEELKAKYEELKKNYCFKSKEEQINYVINNYLNSSNKTNNNSNKIALEELLKEKTGMEYKFEPIEFEISLSDIINFVTKPDADPFWTNSISNYFNNINEISENEKIKFLIELVQDKNSFNEFTKEIIKSQNFNETYEKYKKIARDFIIKNNKKG